MRKIRGRQLWRRRRADAGALGFLAGFFLLFFAWLVWERKFSVGSDAFGYSFPLRTVAWQMIRQGALPLWTPHIMSGYPLLAMGQLAIGYPLTWGYLVLPNVWAEQIYLLAPYLLAPAFTFAYCRQIGRTRLASLLAALAFTYGGIMIGVLGLYGFMSNSVMWLPLMLVAVERARRPGRLIPCICGATAAAALSLLNGYPQGFVYAAVIVCAYGLFVSIALPATADPLATQKTPRAANWLRWQPLLVAVGGQLLALGLSAFQLLETMTAVQQSARITLEQELFRSRTPQLLTYEIGSLIAPLYYWEIPTYIAPVALLLAPFALASLVRRNRRDWRVAFWVAVSVVAWLLLSANAPLYRLFNHLPIFRSFQVPMRHSFEWTFAVSVLSAYGWDVWRARARARANSTNAPAKQRGRMIFTTVLLAICGALAAVWWYRTTHQPTPAPSTPLAILLKSPYLIWKVCLSVLTLAVIWQGHKLKPPGRRRLILLAAVTLACLVEAHISVYQFWRPFAKPAARYQTPGAATQFLQQFPPETNRVYTRVGLFSEEFPNSPRLDPPNVTALYGLHNVAGAEPLILDRYSRALGGVLADTVSPRQGAGWNTFLLTDSRSHVLDLLNTRFVVTYAGLALKPQALVNKDGIVFNDQLNVELSPGQSAGLAALNRSGDTLALVTVLSRSVQIQQGVPVARVLVHMVDGRTLELVLRAGIDTAEWAHERPDVRAAVQHKLAPVFDSPAAGDAQSFPAYRYLARLPLGNPVQVKGAEITNLMGDAVLDVAAVTLFDSARRASTPFLYLDPDRWQSVYDRDDVLILHNARVLPRAWLVGSVEVVNGEEALRRISGDETSGGFDPRRTALLEIKPDEAPALSEAAITNGDARVSYRPNRIEIETNSDRKALLVVSEMSYPGWTATVDGQPARIYTTDYLLQSVVVPAGSHLVEFRYTARGARLGLLISLGTLLGLGALGIAHRRMIKAERARSRSVFPAPRDRRAQQSAAE